jgi:putative flippase GtrA
MSMDMRTRSEGSAPDPVGAHWRSLVRLARLARFLLVGGLSTLVTVGLFNVLVHAGSSPVLGSRPVTAYVVALAGGLVVNYLGNRWWVFAGARHGSRTTHIIAFIVTNAVAFAIPLLCLATSRYVLGLSSVVADNVAANGIGLVLATGTRWLAYRLIVFRADRPETGIESS